ncbi:solute carrier organic anion transporter family member 6C1-like [Acomys russatus]|uniref:solute carrier organic anion transporter family member 6C1-like n=1 Tax=Acomys russatus TaxID=60746 RepID=UPI0021E31109|nr:solute carrier organic anion transporter family member 6C1-like [Acomys russatus]
MAQEPSKETAANKVEPVKEEKDKETEEQSKTGTYLVTIPTAMIKFSKTNKNKEDSGTPQTLSDLKDSDSFKGSFGLGGLVFPSLQRFNNIYSFNIFLSLAMFAHGIVAALVDLSLAEYEKEFSLSRREKFILDFSDYCASFLAAIFIGHYGGRGNRSIWVAVSSFTVVIASITFVYPFIHYVIIRPVEASQELCNPDELAVASCERILPHRTLCFYLFLLGQFLHGIAGMPMIILGVTFIYDHVPLYSCGSYIAVGDAAQQIGYILGYIVGRMGIEPPHDVTVNPDGTSDGLVVWQKPWWLGYFISGTLALIASFPLLCFPATLPGANKVRREKEKERPAFDKRLKDKKYGPHLKDMFRATKWMLKNPLLMSQAFCKVTETVGFKECSFFLPIYLQSQFMLTPSFASSISGFLIFTGLVTSHLVGGMIIDKLKMSWENKVKFTMLSNILSSVLFLLIFFITCETVKSAGINTAYDGTGKIGNLTAPCNVKCECLNSIHIAVCGRDETEYFSPCFAGCKAMKFLSDEKTYYNCSCIKDGLTTTDVEGHFIDAVLGKCNSNCHSLPLFLAFFFASISFANMCSIPVTVTSLQTVPDRFTSLSLGVTCAIWRFAGSFPATFLMREITVKACIYWEITRCGAKGRCWIFNKTILVTLFTGICLQY